jgi:alkaline phosphatase D
MRATPAPDRRRLLALAAAAGAALSLPRWAQGQPRLSSNPFTLGVASGSPRHDGVVLWTRLMVPGLFESLGSAPIAVSWEIAHDEAFARIAAQGQAQALPELGHSVHVEAQGLEPDRWYFYRFMLGDAVSTVGRTRTFPLPDAQVQRLRLAYASCQRWEHGYYSAWRHMRAEQCDAVVFLGDYIYEYPGAADAVRPAAGGWVLTLDDYRRRYALHKGDADLQAMHAACPWLFTWDDHEVQNDYAALQAGTAGPAVADFAARRAWAYQACYENLPLRASVLTGALAGMAQGAEMRIYGAVPFGQLARIALLDARQYRTPQVCTRDGRLGSSLVDPANCPAWDDPARSLLGTAQEGWLDALLAQPRSGWTVIGQQSLFGMRDARPGPGRLLWNDSWDGYGAARSRLTDSLQRHQVADAVFFGGDVHENWVGQVKADYSRADSADVAVEFCGTSITSRAGRDARTGQLLAENPHFVFADAQHRGYGIAEFTPQRLTTTLRVVSDVTRADADIRTLAQFHVQAGRPRVDVG